MKHSRFIAGWEKDFDNPEQLTKILLTQGVDKEGAKLFKKIQIATELIIEDKIIKESIQHEGGDAEEVIVPLPISDWPDRQVFFLKKDPKGNHRIGGKAPSSFTIPHHKSLKSNFIYLATIDGKDPKFSWMGLDELHIAYPLYEGAFAIFLDYQNPNAPEVLNPEVFDYSWINDSVKGVDKVHYFAQQYSTFEQVDLRKLDKNPEDYLFCGVPIWQQYPEIPSCPKTGTVMRYVTSINSDYELKIQDENGVENLPFGNRLIFGDEGNLYVFYEPTSKILCLFVQF